MTTDIEIVDLILLHEGGIYTNDPNDHGGPTKWGITMPVLSEFLGYPATVDNIKNLSRETASNCYQFMFVRPFDLIPDPLRVNAIDFGVNAGVPRSITVLQQIIGADVDGRIGPQTRTLAMSSDWNGLYTGARLAFYEGIIARDHTQIKWRRGWRNRALSFVHHDTRRVARKIQMDRNRDLDEPVFGFMGKAA